MFYVFKNNVDGLSHEVKTWEPHLAFIVVIAEEILLNIPHISKRILTALYERSQYSFALFTDPPE